MHIQHKIFNYHYFFGDSTESLHPCFKVLNKQERQLVAQALQEKKILMSNKEWLTLKEKIHKFKSGQFTFLESIQIIWKRFTNFITGGLSSKELFDLACQFLSKKKEKSLPKGAAQVEHKPTASASPLKKAHGADDTAKKNLSETIITTLKTPSFIEKKDEPIGKASFKPKQAPLPPLKKFSLEEAGEIDCFLAETKKNITLEASQPASLDIGGKAVSQAYIDQLIDILKNTATKDASELFARMEQMNAAAIAGFVSRLSIEKKGREPSDLEYLWIREAKGVFEPREEASKERRLKAIFQSLNESQLQASLQCPQFLSSMSQEPAAKAAATSFTSRQLAIMAKDSQTHSSLANILKKLPSDLQLLDKVIAVLPYCTPAIYDTLEQIISHLPKTSSKVSSRHVHVKLVAKLQHLAKHFAINNSQKTLDQLSALSKSKPLTPPKKHPTVQAGGPVVYAKINLAANKKNWTAAMMQAFIAKLNSQISDIYHLRAELNSMDKAALLQFLALSNTPSSIHHLEKLWAVEKMAVDLTNQAHRQARLAIIFSHLSPFQLEQSTQGPSFYTILADDLQGSSAIAAQSFTAEQLGKIASNQSSLIQMALIQVIKKFPKDDLLKGRLEAIIPHVTPWTAIILERRIMESLSPADKKAAVQNLKKNLASCLKNGDVVWEWNKKATSEEISTVIKLANRK